MARSKISLTIGIPAYNEEANIGFLIHDLLSQKIDKFFLRNIIVSSDASTDHTDEIVRSFSDKRIRLLSNDSRKGQAIRQNQIIDTCDSDILILLNADILIKSHNFIESLVLPITKGKDLVCGPLLEIKPDSLFEKLIVFGSLYRRHVFAKYNKGNNIFTCHGSHRAFSKRLYKTFHFEQNYAEDAFSYLFCIQNGFSYQYASGAIAYIKLPNNFNDHLNQSLRFFAVPDKLSNYFDNSFVLKNTRWPIRIFLIEGLRQFTKHPLEAFAYFFITLYVIFMSKLHQPKNDNWELANSSKNLRK